MKKLLKDRKGTAAIEYALISCLIAVAMIGEMQTLGLAIRGLFIKSAVSFSVASTTSSGSNSGSSTTSTGTSSTSGTDTSGSTSTSTSGGTTSNPNCHGNGKNKC